MKPYNLIQNLIKIALHNKNLVQNEIETIENAIELIKENERLKESLKRCSPLYLSDICGFCVFCEQEIDEGFYGHLNNCEYLTLTGGKNEI